MMMLCFLAAVASAAMARPPEMLRGFINYPGRFQPSNDSWTPSEELGFWDTGLQYVRQMHSQVWISWTPYEDRNEIVFALAMQTLGWMAFGPSETGGMIGASICAIYEQGGEMRAFAYYSGNYTYPTLATVQRCTLLNYTTFNGETMAVFSRNIIGCKPQELDIYSEWDQRWIYAWGVNGNQVFSYHGDYRYTSEFNAILGPPPTYDLPDDAMPFMLTMEPHEIPEHRNVYTCRPMAFPQDQRYHIVKTEPVLHNIDPAKYHHFNVFNCPAGHPPEYWDGLQKQCNSPAGLPPMACFQFFTTWLTGQGDVWFMDAGLPIGAGGNGAAIEVIIQEHIDNTYYTVGLWDDGWGIRAWYTPTLRPQEAGNIGMFTLLPLAGIQPGEVSFPVDSHCGPGCTALNIPQGGVTVLSVSPHMHFAGRTIGVRLIRQNNLTGVWEEQPIIHKLNHWDANWQGVRQRRQNLVILPGDRINMFCTYNSEGLTEPIYNGEGYEDEMCLLPITIRPRLLQMTSCGSFQDDNGGGQFSICDGPPYAAPSDQDQAYVPLPEPPNNCPA